MSELLIKNIGLLAGIEREGKECMKGEEMSQMELLHDAWLLVNDGRIADFGTGTPPL